MEIFQSVRLVPSVCQSVRPCLGLSVYLSVRLSVQYEELMCFFVILLLLLTFTLALFIIALSFDFVLLIFSLLVFYCLHSLAVNQSASLPVVRPSVQQSVVS